MNVLERWRNLSLKFEHAYYLYNYFPKSNEHLFRVDFVEQHSERYECFHKRFVYNQEMPVKFLKEYAKQITEEEALSFITMKELTGD